MFTPKSQGCQGGEAVKVALPLISGKVTFTSHPHLIATGKEREGGGGVKLTQRSYSMWEPWLPRPGGGERVVRGYLHRFDVGG